MCHVAGVEILDGADDLTNDIAGILLLISTLIDEALKKLSTLDPRIRVSSEKSPTSEVECQQTGRTIQ